MKSLGTPWADRRSDAVEIGGVRIAGVGPGFDLLRLEVSLDADPDLTPCVSVLDSASNEVQLGEAAVLGSATYAEPSYPETLRRSICLSVRIPSDLPEFSISVTCDGTKPLRSRLYVSPEEARGLRDSWWSLTNPAECDDGYEEWFRKNHVTMADRAAQKIAQRHFSIRPLFSIVVPLFRTPLSFFSEMTSSVLAQTYDNFELILVNASPEDDALACACRELSAIDERVRVVTLDNNYGITENTNAGVDVARGDFVSFFDHDDLLEPDCLYWYVKGINDYPDTDLLYCDEDKLENGHLSFPYFKPDFDVFYLETNNYVCHMLTIRRELLLRLERPNSELDGAQDHAMALATGDMARNVYHVRRVLYHWRIHSSSTAGNVAAKPESLDAGKLAVARHLALRGERASVENLEDMPHYYRVSLTRASSSSVMVYGRSDDLEVRADTLRDSLPDSVAEVISVAIPSHSALVPTLLAAARSARGEYLVLCSDDVVLPKGNWVEELVSFCARTGVGIVAPVVLYPDGTVRDAGVVCSLEGALRLEFRDLFFEGSPHVRGLLRCPHTVSAVRGACLVIRADLFAEIASSLTGCPGLFWDVALCLEARRRRNLATVVLPSVQVSAPVPELALGGRKSEVLRAYVSGRAWLFKNWPEFFSGADRFYSRQMRQDGYYGLADYR